MVSIKKILITVLMFIPVLAYADTDIVSFYKCVDGDTFKVKKDDEIITVRLLAVDTPESVKPNTEVEYYGKESSEYTCNLVSNAKKIELEYDSNSDEKDKYGRYLAWVFVDDSLLQDELVSNGYAEVAYLYGDYKYTALLQDHEEVAKSKKIGLWGEETNEDDSTSVGEYSLFISICVSLIAIFVGYLKKKLKKLVKNSRI